MSETKRSRERLVLPLSAMPRFAPCIVSVVRACRFQLVHSVLYTKVLDFYATVLLISSSV
eukprot:2689902-Pleurochrysis_carterae.AAC.1